jgi:hypothetical protein
MAQFMLIEKGKSPWTGVVILNGETHNIWKADAEFYHEDSLLEGEAQIEGLKMQPGTPMPAEVDDIQTRIQNDYGIDIADESVDVDGTTDLKTYLEDWTVSVPIGWDVWRSDPFNMKRWV